MKIGRDNEFKKIIFFINKEKNHEILFCFEFLFVLWFQK